MLQDDASAAVWARSATSSRSPRRRARRVAGMADRLPAGLGGALGQALARDTGGDVIYDWGGGLIWAALPPKPDAQAAWCVRASTARAATPR
jgi:glycolate oxidase FAD binding subunit